jgi:hypothetical protein
MAQVVIGVDPHKRSATIEIINDREQAVGQGRFGTTATATRPCSPPGVSTKTVSGPSKAAPGSTGTSKTYQVAADCNSRAGA